MGSQGQQEGQKSRSNRTDVLFTAQGVVATTGATPARIEQSLQDDGNRSETMGRIQMHTMAGNRGSIGNPRIFRLSTDDSDLSVLHFRKFDSTRNEPVPGIFGMPSEGHNEDSLSGVVGKPGRFKYNNGRSKWKIAKSEFDRGSVCPTDRKFVGNSAEKGLK